ncbi:ADP-ribosylglycohydrolase-domain-containing protein [Fimicolochytrium jonesii]|uniref:ADP-ribosylglycohydrolase-domain-containing protein n=1 Tax=Fimicolochytrium jonesii TaxID=1396493 RepID=UPI0022FEFE0E|nr:ADP-ribosylglycohydrolase-domain-containing protein [Fimicolochytrium jonesii]KAI8817514.1 ADP-ribosylglycohydrolase-domain-containing protein [Fimicolochytrium jonesii]
MIVVLQSFLGTTTKDAQRPQFDTLDFARRLRKWTQEGLPELGNPAHGIGKTMTLVIGQEDFCTDPQGAAWRAWHRDTGRAAAANGAVMRCAVLGCVGFQDEGSVARMAIDCALCTHADPRCVLSCVVVCVLVARMLREEVGGSPSATVTPLGEAVKRDLWLMVHGRDQLKTVNVAAPTVVAESPSSQTNSPPARRPRFLIDKKAKERLFMFVMGGSDDDTLAKPPNYLARYDRPPAASSSPSSPTTIDVGTLPRDAAVSALIQDVCKEYEFLLHGPTPIPEAQIRQQPELRPTAPALSPCKPTSTPRRPQQRSSEPTLAKTRHSARSNWTIASIWGTRTRLSGPGCTCLGGI